MTENITSLAGVKKRILYDAVPSWETIYANYHRSTACSGIIHLSHTDGSKSKPSKWLDWRERLTKYRKCSGQHDKGLISQHAC